jgi:hypothetical protein
MRRPTKATTSSSRNGTTTAAFSTGYENLPPSSTTSSHLELSSANADDNEITSKIHKKKYNKQRYQRGSSIAIAAVCSLIAFGTLYFVAKYVSSMISIGGTKSRSTSASIHHQQRKTILAENNNVNEDKYNHHHHTNQLPPDSIYRAKVTDMHGTLQDLHQYAGSISLIVNVACE